MTTVAKKRNTAFDFIKVIFLLLIIIHHSDVIPINHCLYLGVELFFIISGYLLYQSYERNCVDGQIPFIKHRIKQLYPRYLLAFVLILIVFFLLRIRLGYEHPIGLIYELFMIQNIGLPYSGGLNYPCWYISVLMFSTIILCIIWKVIRSKTARLVIHIILAVLIYSVLFMNNSSTLEQWGRLGNVVYIPLLRGLAGMAMGAFLFQIRFKPTVLRYFDLPIMLTIVAAMLINISEYVILLLIVLLVYAASLENSLLDKVGKCGLIQFFIKHEYTMYLNHALIIFVLYMFIRQKVSSLSFCIIASTAVIVISVGLDLVGRIFRETVRKIRNGQLKN